MYPVAFITSEQWISWNKTTSDIDSAGHFNNHILGNQTAGDEKYTCFRHWLERKCIMPSKSNGLIRLWGGFCIQLFKLNITSTFQFPSVSVNERSGVTALADCLRHPPSGIDRGSWVGGGGSGRVKNNSSRYLSIIDSFCKYEKSFNLTDDLQYRWSATRVRLTTVYSTKQNLLFRGIHRRRIIKINVVFSRAWRFLWFPASTFLISGGHFCFFFTRGSAWIGFG